MRVSILIPCYNAEGWIAQAIESALAQSVGNLEVIVVDDGSTDRSLQTIQKFGTSVRWESQPNLGGNAARNRLLEMAAGEWVQYLDADDFLLPEKIGQQLKELPQHGDIDVAYAPVIFRYQEEQGGYHDVPFVIEDQTDHWNNLIRWKLPQTSGPLWRTQALREVGGWKTGQKCCQEHELYLRLLQAGRRFHYCPTANAVYRQWSTETVCRRNPQQTILARMAIVDECERFLMAQGELTSVRRQSVAATRYECARSLWTLNRAEARALARKAGLAFPNFRLPDAPCFPAAYRRMFSLFGFAATERLAEFAREMSGSKAGQSQT
jgi:GT2 family glycosyltransferase